MRKELNVNPWLKMWTSPRETIRAIIEYNPSYLLPLLYWIYGFPTFLNMMQNASLGEKLPLIAILGLAVIFAIVSGWIGINLGAALFYWTGKWIGGQGSYKEVRAAAAWAACVPSVVNGAIWIILIATFKNYLFTQQFFATNFTGMLTGVVFALTAMQTALAIWGFIMLLKAIGEVQQFSAWKALLNIILPLAVLFIGMMLIMFLFSGGMH